jgi:hypothetical protein
VRQKIPARDRDSRWTSVSFQRSPFRIPIADIQGLKSSQIFCSHSQSAEATSLLRSPDQLMNISKLFLPFDHIISGRAAPERLDGALRFSGHRGD